MDQQKSAPIYPISWGQAANGSCKIQLIDPLGDILETIEVPVNSTKNEVEQKFHICGKLPDGARVHYMGFAPN